MCLTAVNVTSDACQSTGKIGTDLEQLNFLGPVLSHFSPWFLHKRLQLHCVQ